MDKKQSVEKRAIIQNGIASIPIGFLCGGPLGAVTVAGATALMAHMEEKKDQELRQKEWERKHPAPPTIEEQMKKIEDRKERNRKISEISDCITVEFPYKDREFKLVKDRSLYCSDNWESETPVYILYTDKKSSSLFPEYDKILFGKICGIDNFYNRFMSDKDKPGFTAYYLHENLRGRFISYIYTTDGANYYLY